MNSIVESKIKVEFSLSGMKKFMSFSIPEIKIYQDQIPLETTKLKIILVDLDFYNFRHGKKIIPYVGSDIFMHGTFKIIPLSPLDGTHRYQLTVYALNEDKKIIAEGKSIQLFPKE